MDHLKSRSNRKQILIALDSLPSTVDEMYRQALQRIKDEHRQLAFRVLSWILHAHRPLTIVELQHALAFDGGTADIDLNVLDDEVFVQSVCCGLVTSQQRQSYDLVTDKFLNVQELGFVR
jgi:hypothetical protein